MLNHLTDVTESILKKLSDQPLATPPQTTIGQEFKITTTATATGTSLNKRFNEQNNIRELKHARF